MTPTQTIKIGTIEFLDLRDVLPRANWSIGRNSKKTSATKHYNGPPVQNRTRAGEIAQLIEDAKWHMRPDAFGPGLPGDGLQYHIAVLSDGTPCLCRNLDAVLWHCANADGNSSSVSTHYPVGGAQDLTEPQWATGKLVYEMLGNLFHFGREKVLGHKEWPKYVRINGVLTRVKNSDCPGPNLMRRLNAWRAGVELTKYVVLYNDAYVREGPGTKFPIALGGKAIYQAGQPIVCDGITLGEYVGGSNRWPHFANGIGFIHSSLVRQVS